MKRSEQGHVDLVTVGVILLGIIVLLLLFGRPYWR